MFYKVTPMSLVSQYNPCLKKSSHKPFHSFALSCKSSMIRWDERGRVRLMRCKNISDWILDHSGKFASFCFMPHMRILYTYWNMGLWTKNAFWLHMQPRTNLNVMTCFRIQQKLTPALNCANIQEIMTSASGLRVISSFQYIQYILLHVCFSTYACPRQHTENV